MLNLTPLKWASSKQTNNIASEHKINKDELLFSKVEDEIILKQLQKLEESKKINQSTLKSISEIKVETTFDDFSKMDIRTATILEAEKVPKTEKLLKLTLDTGIDKRTVVSGIAQFYEPEKIIGQKVCLLANLAPRKIKGIESKGMILMAENAKGELCFVSPTSNEFNNGSEVK